MAITLVDHPLIHGQLEPLTSTRAIANLRIGILTIREKWQHFLGEDVQVKTVDYLQETPIGDEGLPIASHILPNEALVQRIQELLPNQGLFTEEGTWIAGLKKPSGENRMRWKEEIVSITRPWHIFSLNDEALRSDFQMLTHGRTSQTIPDYCTVIGPIKNIFIEEGAVVEPCVIHSESGPVYIGSHAKILAGTLIRGGLALLPNAVLKMGAKIYGATTIGPYCKVGGEVNNSVFWGFSNKGHDGYLGNAVIGAWCNLGADTNNSNLKNNYGPVKMYSYAEGEMVDTGLQFAGLVMGDHAKSSINTMFNTGTVAGVFANIFDAGFPPKFIKPFAWGKDGIYRLEKAFEVAERMMVRRGLSLTAKEKEVLTYLYNKAQSL